MSINIIYVNMCRLCLKTGGHLLPLFKSDSDGLTNTIMALTTIKIKKNDGFPEHICIKCSQRLKSAFEFKQQCENSDCWLRNSKDSDIIYSLEIRNEDLYNEHENVDDNIGFDDFGDVKDEFETCKADGQPYYVEVEPDIANLENPLLDTDPISEAISTPNKVKARRKMKKKIEVAEDPSDSDDIPVKALNDKSDRTDGDSDSQMFNGVKAYTCSHCKDVFTSLYQFQVHKTTHPCKFECVVCNQKFLTAGGLESHLKAYKNNCASTECNVCHKKYKTSKLLLKHKRVHEGKSKLECTYCKKEFSFSGNLKRHLMIHDNDRLFECHCGMSFNQATGLKQHMFYKHTTERPHLCNICGHRFKDKRALSKHVAVRHLDITDKSHSIELPFACSYCPKRFSQRAGLKHHTYVHTRERPYSCKILKNDGFPEHICSKCSVRLTSAFEFKQQCEKSDSMLRNSESELCKKYELSSGNTECKRKLQVKIKANDNNVTANTGSNNFFKLNTGDKDFEEHEENSDLNSDQSDSVLVELYDDKSLSCSMCNETFVNHWQLQQHKISHRKFKCVKCNRKFNSSTGYQSHLKDNRHEFSNVECDVCHKTYKSYRHLTKHKIIHTGKTRMPCSVCRKVFSNSGNLKRHMMIHDGKKPFVCHYCGMSFNQVASLNLHVSGKHTTDRPHLCNVCGRRFKDSKALDKHVEFRHVETADKKPHTCSVCAKVLSTKQTLKYHMNSHSDNPTKPFLCMECGKSFKTKYRLEVHERSHTGERPFACLHCPKRFSQHSGLKVHTYIHTGERPYSCKVCNKNFSQINHVNEHMYTHSGEKKHKCDVCNHAFALKGNLKSHMMTHTGETPFTCNTCGKGFYVAYKLKQHITKAHIS